MSREYLARQAARVEERLRRILPEDGYPPQLLAAMRYSLLAPGKRLRPVLLMAAAEAAGGETEKVLPAACAVEAVHAYSLIHDDLPCMDDSDLRRGRPSCHRAFGEATALLAGDALQALAFEQLTGAEQVAACGPARVLTAVRELAQAAGWDGLVGGQTVDLASEGRSVDEATLGYIHGHKTGALWRAAVRMGATLAGSNEHALARLTAYAEAFGLVFQITDDILDAVGEAKDLGKPAGADGARGKATYPARYGIAESRRRARHLAGEALGQLDELGDKAVPLAGLLELVLERDR
jgi:geranylgeranyl diphosphate synthase type II